MTEKDTIRLGYLEKYARGNVYVDTRDQYHRNLVFVFDQFNAIKAENASLITIIESLQEKSDEFEERYTDSQFHVKALSDAENVHLAQIESQKEEIKNLRDACTEILAAHNKRGAIMTGACGDNQAVIKARLALSFIQEGEK
jgi:hypothetical protein